MSEFSPELLINPGVYFVSTPLWPRLQVLLQHFVWRRSEEGRRASHPSSSTAEDPLQSLLTGPQQALSAGSSRYNPHLLSCFLTHTLRAQTAWNYIWSMVLCLKQFSIHGRIKGEIEIGVFFYCSGWKVRSTHWFYICGWCYSLEQRRNVAEVN